MFPSALFLISSCAVLLADFAESGGWGSLVFGAICGLLGIDLLRPTDD